MGAAAAAGLAAEAGVGKGAADVEVDFVEVESAEVEVVEPWGAGAAWTPPRMQRVNVYGYTYCTFCFLEPLLH